MPISTAHWLSAVTVEGDNWTPFSRRCQTPRGPMAKCSEGNCGQPIQAAALGRGSAIDSRGMQRATYSVDGAGLRLHIQFTVNSLYLVSHADRPESRRATRAFTLRNDVAVGAQPAEHLRRGSGLGARASGSFPPRSPPVAPCARPCTTCPALCTSPGNCTDSFCNKVDSTIFCVFDPHLAVHWLMLQVYPRPVATRKLVLCSCDPLFESISHSVRLAGHGRLSWTCQSECLPVSLRQALTSSVSSAALDHRDARCWTKKQAEKQFNVGTRRLVALSQRDRSTPSLVYGTDLLVHRRLELRSSFITPAGSRNSGNLQRLVPSFNAQKWRRLIPLNVGVLVADEGEARWIRSRVVTQGRVKHGRSARKSASGIVRHDSHVRTGIEPGSPWWEASALAAVHCGPRLDKQQVEYPAVRVQPLASLSKLQVRVEGELILLPFPLLYTVPAHCLQTCSNGCEGYGWPRRSLHNCDSAMSSGVQSAGKPINLMIGGRACMAAEEPSIPAEAYKIDAQRMYTEVTFAIGSQFIGHALDDSDLQGNNNFSLIDLLPLQESFRSGEIWAALNIEVLRADEGETSARMQRRGKLEIPEETRRPTASYGTIPTCENPGATAPGIEPGSL
ncbi:hypothetical protein PR048_029297 [Dryococelus australis]|uniref:Uncharacterized protein n=1 Tax=Dryococelus australis TaxID=614101 RepID=A0ABQ9GD21_9NEOP|nr:hypothetical protein PR048_029297 [Dryococelus australis]